MNTQTIWETYLNSRQRAAPLKKDRASPSEKNHNDTVWQNGERLITSPIIPKNPEGEKVGHNKRISSK